MKKEQLEKFMKDLSKNGVNDKIISISKKEFNNIKKEADKWIKWGESENHKWLPFYYSDKDYAGVKKDGSDQIKYYLKKCEDESYEEDGKVMVSKMSYDDLKQIINDMIKNKKDIISKKEPSFYGADYSDEELAELAKMALKEDTNYFLY